MTKSIPIEHYFLEQEFNRLSQSRKPILKLVYGHFYRAIADQLNRSIPGEIVEVGSGVATICDVVPDCIRTDIFPNPSLDPVENIYDLSSWYPILQKVDAVCDYLPPLFGTRTLVVIEKRAAV